MIKKPRLTDICHDKIGSLLRAGDCAIDATAGNGHDTLFLSRAVGESGHVIGFDIQASAIESTQLRLSENRAPSKVTLILDSHDNMSKHIPETCRSRIRAIVFNLGYLPGSDKKIITRTEETLPAIEQALDLLKPGGLLSIMAYPGHSGGREETDRVIDLICSLEMKVFSTSVTRSESENGPVLLMAIRHQNG
ncbi:MAG: class I SAM-dependent methyltransferase [Sedimenticola sp.]